MPAIDVKYGHVLSDLVSDEDLFAAADMNGIGITDALLVGTSVTVPAQVRPSLSRESIEPVFKVPDVVSLAGQRWIDLALQQLGDEERLFEFCDANGVGITDDLEVGTVVKSPAFDTTKKSAVHALKRLKPASGNVQGDAVQIEGGIEYWAIELDFLVS